MLGLDTVILGIGADLCGIERIRQAVARRGSAFLNHMFTSREQVDAAAAADEAAAFAFGFAAKEAASKALGTGVTDKIGWHDFKVDLLGPGLSTLSLEAGAERRLRRLAPRGHAYTVHLSGQIDKTHAYALVFLSATHRDVAGIR